MWESGFHFHHRNPAGSSGGHLGMFEVLWATHGNLADWSCLLCRALCLQRAEMTMTANKNSSITHGAGGTKAPRGTLSRWVGEHCLGEWSSVEGRLKGHLTPYVLDRTAAKCVWLSSWFWQSSRWIIWAKLQPLTKQWDLRAFSYAF